MNSSSSLRPPDVGLDASCGFVRRRSYILFFFNDTATTEIYTLSLHDALPISFSSRHPLSCPDLQALRLSFLVKEPCRSEEHTSELQSRQYLVCRLLLEKKKEQLTCIQYLRQACTLTI